MSTQQIGTTAFTIAGEAIGAYFGGPVGAAIGGLAGGLIGSLIFGRKNTALVPDVKIMNSNFGHPIPIIYGTARLPGMMIWEDDLQTKSKGIGKGGGGLGGGSSTYAYWQSAAIAFCEGPAAIKKLFLDGKLFFDATEINPHEYTKYRFTIRTYYGYPDQVADPLMKNWANSHVLPANACPDYHGLCYLVFDRPDLAHFGNRFPQATAIWTTTAQRTTLYKEVIPWDGNSAGLGSGGFANGFYRQGSVQVDWTRMVAYFISGAWPPDSTKNPDDQQFTIKSIDLNTARQIGQANWDSLFGDRLLPPDMTNMFSHVQGIALCQGGSLYVYCNDYAGHWIAKVNPDTLECNDTPVAWKPPFGATSLPDEGATGIDNIAFSVISANGTDEFMFTTYEASYYKTVSGCVLIDPGTGHVSILPIPEAIHLNVFGNYGSFSIALGASDPTAGTQDIWATFSIWGTYIPTSPWRDIFVYKGTVGSNGIDDVGWHLAGTITPGMYGWDAPPTDPFLNYGPDVSWISYYKGDDSLIFRTGRGFFRWFPASNTCQVIVAGTSGDIQLSGGQLLVNDYGYMVLLGESFFDPGFYNIDLPTGKITHFDADDLVTHGAPLGGFGIGSSYGNTLLYRNFSGGWTIAYLNRMVDDAEYPVSEIIRDLCHRVGVTDDMLDVSLVTQTTPGYVIQENKSAGMCISDLLHVYEIDMVESDFKLKFIPRGQAVAATVPQQDLISVDPSDPAQYWRVKQAQQQEMPLQIVVKFQDPALDFESGSTYAKRTELPVPTSWSKRRTTLDLPVVVSSLQARQIVDRWLYTMWAERSTAEATLSPKYLYLDPGDNITVTFDNGDVVTTRIEEENIATDLSMHLQLAYEDIAVYNPAPNLKGATYSRAPQTVQSSPFGALLQFNVPLLQDSDDTAGVSTRIYYAAGAYSSGWRTGELFISTDNSVSWQDFAAMNSSAPWGHATTTLKDTPSKFATDISNTVTVSPMAGSTAPFACTYDEMLSGANAALLGQEIIQFQFAADNHDGTYTLSNILRGRRGTEWATGTHSTGELFLPLILGQLGARTLPLSSIGEQRLYKLVPQGRFIDQAPTDPYTYRGYDLKPYAPVLFKRTPTGADLLLSWTRRTRLAGYFIDSTDTAPLYEDSEGYEAYVLADAHAVDLFDPGNPASYQRAWTGLTVPNVTYTAAQMSADGFNRATSTLYLAVYQMSAAIGRGFQGYMAVPAF